MKKNNSFQKIQDFLYHGSNLIINFDTSDKYKYNQAVNPAIRRMALFVVWVLSIALSGIIGPYAFIAASIVGTLNVFTGIYSAVSYSIKSSKEITTVKPKSGSDYGGDQTVNAKYQIVKQDPSSDNDNDHNANTNGKP